MRSRIARALRRLADKVSPNYLRAIEVKWEAGKSPYVDIEFKNQRVSGYVQNELDRMAVSAGTAAQIGIDLANRTIREMGKTTAQACSPLKLHPTKPGHCICGQRLNMHDQAYCVPDEDDNV